MNISRMTFVMEYLLDCENLPVRRAGIANVPRTVSMIKGRTRIWLPLVQSNISAERRNIDHPRLLRIPPSMSMLSAVYLSPE